MFVFADEPPRPPVLTCEQRSMAGFPRAFSNPENLVVGPLVMVGAARFTTEQTVRDFGGNKFQLLVENRHRVRIRVVSDDAALAYGPGPEGRAKLRDGRRVMRFRACRRRSGSRSGRRKVTFWSGFVLTSRPQCVRLRVRVDGRRRARRTAIPLGRECG
jgi:hypothetical protein